MRPRNIIPLDSTRVIPGSNYLIDTNIWILALSQFSDMKPWENKYVDFFFEIVDCPLTPAPKILMPTLLMSELVNTYLRKFAMVDYKVEIGMDENEKLDFKTEYRVTQHYRNRFEQLIDDITSYSTTLRFFDDRGIVANPALLLNKAIDEFDYNAYLYYAICRELKKTERIAIVTNDGDYHPDDLDIITSNRKLLNL
jgi:hypothetical protein